ATSREQITRRASGEWYKCGDTLVSSEFWRYCEKQYFLVVPLWKKWGVEEKQDARLGRRPLQVQSRRSESRDSAFTEKTRKSRRDALTGRVGVTKNKVGSGYVRADRSAKTAKDGGDHKRRRRGSV